MAEVPQDFDNGLSEEPMDEGAEEPLEGEVTEPIAEEEQQETDSSKGPVPWERFQEVYSRGKALESEAAQQRELLWRQQQALLQAQQYAFTQNQRQTPEPQMDPQLAEVEKIIAPLIEKRLAPVQQRLGQYQQAAMKMEAQEEAQSALAFFEQQVPDHKDLEPDFLAYLQSQPQPVQQRVFQDPWFAVQTANTVRALRDAGQLKASGKAKEAMRSRAKSESGGNSPSITSSHKVDWENLSDTDFAKYDAAIMRRRGL